MANSQIWFQAVFPENTQANPKEIKRKKGQSQKITMSGYFSLNS